MAVPTLHHTDDTGSMPLSPRRAQAGRLHRLLACLVAALALTAALGGCGLIGEKADPTKGWSSAKFYSEAKAALANEQYEEAIEYFEKLEARYPYGRYAQQAQLEIAYAYYKYDEPDSAIAAADRFLKLHPRHPNADYAYYLKGLVNFNRGRTFLQRLLKTDDSERDIEAARQAFRDFRELVEKYPNSRYAQDARQRMRYLRNTMAEHQIHVGRFYMKRKAYVAAVNRAKHVLNEYPQTPSVPEALGLMSEAYRALGMDALAQDAERVLSANYPDHPALARLRSQGR